MEGDPITLLRTLSDAADEINGAIDAQAYDARRRDPDDPEADVILPWVKIDAMDAAICAAQRYLRALPTPKGTPK